MNVVAHNLPSMFTNRQLGITTNNKAKSAEKLSSGYKINRASDDAAGLSISEKMRKQIRGLRQGADNIQDGISFCQTADGYLNEVVDMLHRMNELSIKAANGTNSASDRMDIDNEIQELKEETNRILKTAKFNETYIFRLPYTPGVSVVRDYDENSTSLVKTSSKFPPGASLDSVSQSSGHMSNTFSKEGVTYKSASYIDFSGVDFSDISSLDGTGFFSTCCTCTNNYCVTFDSSSSDHTLVGNENYTYTVGTFGVSNASELIDRIVEATGGKPQDHYSIYEKDPTNSNILVIYDERPDQTAGDEYGKIYSGVVKEVTYRSQGEPMKIFSNGLRGGDISYGGIELNDVRHNWSEMGIDISSDGKTFAKDQQVSFYDYKGEYVELHVKAGDPLYQITRRNYWSADGKGVYVNDIFAASWKDIGIKEKNNNGDFSFQFRDQIISFEVNDGDNLEDVINGINARQLNTRNSWDITTSEVERGKALDLFDVNALRVTEANKDAFDYKYWISIYGNGTDDESGITITSSDGVEHTKTSWKDFENIASLGENDKYPISDWGITDRDNKGTKSDRVTFDDAATYKYVNKAQTDLNISFSFNLKDETGLD
ncbi:MAG: flagellin, partial [Lachnospiraceae bacterium]|nr:flagellin [Lachnospiraceae bacterium]